MIKSMTGYGRGESSNQDLSISIDLKSVNNKYLDIQVKMPIYLFPFEEAIKKEIRKRISRGRVDVYIRDSKGTRAKSQIIVDRQLGVKMYEAVKSLNDELGLKDDIKLDHILINNEVLEFKPVELDESSIRECVLIAAEMAVNGVLEMKVREGELLYEDLKDIILELSDIIVRIENRAPKLIQNYRARLSARVEELLSGISDYDQDKINSEVAIYAERSDINEEIVRFKSHLKQFMETMNSNGAVGKKLDFISQELNREINTISSKSNDTLITEDVIEVKSKIDKLKEQVQNIE